MSKIQCIIVEDEPLATKVLSDYISQVPFIELKKTFKDALAAADYLRDHPVDLIFLDIHMPKLKGTDFLKTLINPPAVILTTAYQQYAIEGYEMNVTDYLLKPFEFNRFLVAVNKVNSNRETHQKQSTELKDFIFLTIQKEKVKILFGDILFIESQKEYVRIVTTKQEYFSRITTSEIEDMLPSRQFKRVHRSFIISVHKIVSYTADIIKVGEFSIPVGKAYRDILLGL